MHVLRYNRPAKFWLECLPLGNGKLGIMSDSGMKNETLYINDDTLWAGYPKDFYSKKSYENLDRVRELLFSGRHKEAESIMYKNMLGDDCASYLPLGKIKLKFMGSFKKKYERSLDIQNSVLSTSGESKAAAVKREMFCSYPDKQAVYRISADKGICFSVSACSLLNSQISAENGTLTVTGTAPDFAAHRGRKIKNPVRYDEGKGMSFALYLTVKTDGKATSRNGRIRIENAKETEIRFTTETGFKSWSELPESNAERPLARCKERIENSKKISYDELMGRHIADVRKLYDRVDFRLDGGKESDVAKLLENAKRGTVDNNLVVLFYNFGRYLTIASAREGTQATTLQGIWTNYLRPHWGSDYTVNINTQMNYWHIGRCRLFEAGDTYKDFMDGLSLSGRKTAKINYGCEGFCSNHNVDIWKKTAPTGGHLQWAYFPLAGAWLTNELFAHYEYREGSIAFEEIKETVTEAVRFVSEYLVERDGVYHICPSTSPELDFRTEEGRFSTDFSSACDLGIVRQLFKNYKKLSGICDTDKKLLEKISEQEEKLCDFSLGETGINEWSKFYPVVEKGHRHFSPLYALYPGNLVERGSEREKWMKQLLDYRCENGSAYTGWSAAWAVCLYARLGDGKRAYDYLKKLFANSLFKNLFDSHPPAIFQIDGNFGGVAGINEMLVTEIEGEPVLLNALPKEWASGSIEGLGLSGGRTLSMHWKDGEVTSMKIAIR